MESVMQTLSVIWVQFSVLKTLYWFITGIVLVVVLHKIDWLRRQHIVHRVFCGLFYLYIPFVFLGVGISYNGVKAYEKTLLSVADGYAKEINSHTVAVASPLLQHMDNMNLLGKEGSPKAAIQNLSNQLADETIRQIASVAPFMARFLNQPEEEKSASYLAVQGALSTAMLYAMEEVVVPKVAGKTGADKEGLKAFWTENIKQSLANGLVVL